MKHFLNLMRNFFASMLALIMAFIPLSGGRESQGGNELKLKVALVSDVHIDRRLPAGQLALKNFYEDANAFGPDAVAVLGDLTNYGDYATTERFFQITKESVADGVQPIVISGNHDIGHAKEADGARMNPEALADFVSLCNEYLNYGIDAPYYTIEVNGYSFICMNEESEDNWDSPEYSDAQIAFLDSELARATAGGKPAFVLVHVPLAGIHGEEYFYADGTTEEPWNTAVRTTLEKYDNVFCLSGHLHKGLSNDVKTPTYAEKNGVHYLTLPAYLMPNWPVDISINGIGFIMEVTDSSVTFRCRNYYLRNWVANFDYTTPLV